MAACRHAAHPYRPPPTPHPVYFVRLRWKRWSSEVGGSSLAVLRRAARGVAAVDTTRGSPLLPVWGCRCRRSVGRSRQRQRSSAGGVWAPAPCRHTGPLHLPCLLEPPRTPRESTTINGNLGCRASGKRSDKRTLPGTGCIGPQPSTRPLARCPIAHRKVEFSPNAYTGTSEAPVRSAIFTNPLLLLSTRSLAPGLACRLCSERAGQGVEPGGGGAGCARRELYTRRCEAGVQACNRTETDGSGTPCVRLQAAAKPSDTLVLKRAAALLCRRRRR